MKKINAVSYDILGISTATMCLVHCIIFPLVTIIPFGFSHNFWIDILFACVALLVVSKILMSNATLAVKLLLGVSILLIIINILLEIIFDIHTELIVAGGIGMIVGHVLNYRSHSH